MRPSRIQITSVACGKKDGKQAASRDLYNLCKLDSHKQFAALLCFYLNVRIFFLQLKALFDSRVSLNVEIKIISVYIVDFSPCNKTKHWKSTKIYCSDNLHTATQTLRDRWTLTIAIKPKLNMKWRDSPVDYGSCLNIDTSLSPVEKAH